MPRPLSTLKRSHTMKHLAWFLQKLFLPFVLGIVACTSLSFLFSILNINYLLGWANDNLLFSKLPKTLLLRPISDLLPFALIFVFLYHLYNFAKDSYMRKEALGQFAAGAFVYLLATSLIGPLAATVLCFLWPFVYVFVKEKHQGYYLDPISIIAAPFQTLGWVPGYLFGLGLSQGFLIALPYFVILLGAPYIAIYLICLFDKDL